MDHHSRWDRYHPAGRTIPVSQCSNRPSHSKVPRKIHRISARYGGDLRNIGGTYITDFEVTNVTTLKPAPAGILVSLELKRLRVAYNLLSFLKGLNTFLGDTAVEFEAAKLELVSDTLLNDNVNKFSS